MSAVAGILNPGTSILASGGACPIALCLGDETLQFAWDHRVYDGSDAAQLYARFFGRSSCPSSVEASSIMEGRAS